MNDTRRQRKALGKNIAFTYDAGDKSSSMMLLSSGQRRRDIDLASSVKLFALPFIRQ